MLANTRWFVSFDACQPPEASSLFSLFTPFPSSFFFSFFLIDAPPLPFDSRFSNKIFFRFFLDLIKFFLISLSFSQEFLLDRNISFRDGDKNFDPPPPLEFIFISRYPFFFFSLHPFTHVEEEWEYAILFRGQIFGSGGGGGEKRKIHRSFVERCLHPLESSLQYERSHLPDKGTNNRSLLLSYPLPPSSSFFSSLPWTGNGDSAAVSTPESFEVAIRGRFPGGCPRAIDFFVSSCLFGPG